MDLKYLRDIVVYVVTAVISILVIAYIVIQISGGFSHEIETVPAVYVTERLFDSLDAYIIRKEKVIYSGTNGSVSFLFENGEKIGANTVVARVYSGSDIRDDIIALDRKISILEDSSLNENFASLDAAIIDNKISSLYITICNKAADGDISYAIRRRDELLTLLNKRQIVVKNVEGYDDIIKSLEAEKELLNQSLVGIPEEIISVQPGYFYDSVDGYEDVFSAVNIDTMTMSDYDMLTKASASDISGGDVRGYPIGKIATEYAWYLVCETNYENLHSYVLNSTYTLIYPYSGNREIKATLYRTITEPNSDRVLLVFKNGIVDSSFNFLRKQTVEIVQSSYSGYRIPISAVRIVDGVKGVYIVKGSVVYFREIVPIFEKNGYMIVEPKDSTNADHANRLALYEMVITESGDYYEGQIVE